MNCTKCGHVLSGDTKFCTFCGAVAAEPTIPNEIHEGVPPQTPQTPAEPTVDTPPPSAGARLDAIPSAPSVAHAEQLNNEPPKGKRKRLSKKAMPAVVLSGCAVVLAVAMAFIIPAVRERGRESRYESAVALMSASEYGEAKEVFLSLGEYEDAAEQAAACQSAMDYDAANQLLEAGKYQDAKAAFEAIGSYRDASAKATECQNALDYSTAKDLMASGDYTGAQERFSQLGSYKDSAALAQECMNKNIYEEALALMETGNYADATVKLELLVPVGYEDSEALLNECGRNLNYAEAGAAYDEGKFYTAYELFSSLGDFMDSAARAELCAQDYPATGEIYRNGDYSGSAVTLNVETPKDDSHPTFMKIYTADGTHVLSLFIRGGDSPRVKLPANTYMIKTAYGESWYGPEEMFGDEAIYQTLLLEGSKTYAFQKNYIYTLTLRSAEEGNVDTETESRDKF